MARVLPAKDRSIDAAKFEGSGREAEYRIEGNPGLVLVVMAPNAKGMSAKVWRCYYSLTVGGKRTIRKVRIGAYPLVGLAKARLRAAEIIEAVQQGADPFGEERERKAAKARDALTFANLVGDYVADQRRAGFASVAEVERALTRDAVPVLGHLQPSAITAVDVQRVVDGIFGRGSSSMARHVLRYIKQLYNHALFDNEELRQRYGLTANPAQNLGGNRRGKPGRYGKDKTRKRFLTDAEIGEFWKGLDASDIDERTQLLLRLLLLTGVRVSELRQATISELVLDGAEPVWRLPENRTKNRKPHDVPLAPLTLALFRQAVGGRLKGPVFPSSESATGYLGKFTPRHAIKRLIRGKRRPLNLKHFSPHDLRRTVDTGMAKLGLPEDVLIRVLNQTPQGVNAKHYNHYRYDAERRAALAKWAAHVATLTASHP